MSGARGFFVKTSGKGTAVITRQSDGKVKLVLDDGEVVWIDLADWKAICRGEKTREEFR